MGVRVDYFSVWPGSWQKVSTKCLRFKGKCLPALFALSDTAWMQAYQSPQSCCRLAKIAGPAVSVRSTLGPRRMA